MWVATADLPQSAGHPFYARLNRVLDDAGFDTFVETQCAKFYAEGLGRPSVTPGRYFRLLLLGYVEGLDSERAIAWRAADSLSIRDFLDFDLHEAPPDHSTLSRTRRLIDVDTHQAVFTWVLQRLAEANLVHGHTIGIDATTLEANAAMRSIVRRDTGEAYEAWLTRLAAASGIATPTRAELARFDRTRKKKGSNDDWTHPHDPDAKITKMKDGRTHLAHTAEQAVDLETGAIVGVTVQDADDGDTTTLVETLITAAEQVEAVLPAGAGIAEVVGDKGYHSNETMVAFRELDIRSYISEPDRGRRHWQGKAAARAAVYANRRRIRGARGKRLLRQRGELLERPNAHLYETGRLRRVHLRHHPNILKRVLVHVCGFNLGLLMRQLTGVGTPRSLQGRAAAICTALIGLLAELWEPVRPSWAVTLHNPFRVVGQRRRDTCIRTLDPQVTNQPFCHGLLAAKVPRSNVTLPNSELGIVKREVGKKRRHMAVRQLFQNIPNLLPRLKPCLLMSPMSVAQYLDAGHKVFDLVVFDEASQIPVWDAVGAIARAKQAVIVGDPKQLPPTSFFGKTEDDDNEAPETELVDDLESILDECIGSGLPTLTLNWHYRSLHESLIAFSNYNYYENRLLTFPSSQRTGIAGC